MKREKIDQGKRRLLKSLPLAAMAPALMLDAGNQNADGYELSANKSYVFKIPENSRQEDLNALADRLRSRGINATVIAGDVEIYELL